MTNKNRLVGLLDILEERSIFTFDVDSIESRKILQKYVYLAKNFESNFQYFYNLYIHGPYSPSLAEDYYHLEGTRPEIPEIDNRFFDLIIDKSSRWLELGSTLLYYKKKHPTISNYKLIKRTQLKKSSSTEDELKRILSELESFNLT